MLALGLLYGTWVLLARGSTNDPERSLFQKQSEETAREVGFALSMAVNELELIIDSDDVLHGAADVTYLQNHILRSRDLESVTIYDEQSEAELSTREDNPHSGGSERLFKQVSQGSPCISKPNDGGGSLTLGTANVRLRDGEFGMLPEKTGGEFVRITIEDVGCGLSDAVAQRMFEPFFSTEKDVGRQGLGLAMAYGTIQRHGGWINCESMPGGRHSIRGLRNKSRRKGQTDEYGTEDY